MKKLLIASLVGASLVTALPVAQAQEGSWMIRARAVNLDWNNGMEDGLQSSLGGAVVSAKNKLVPEVDITYFFTKNVAAELVLTYPQKVKVRADGTDIGSVKALPPSLLLQYHFTDMGQFKPYIGAGVNYTLFSDRQIGDSGVEIEKSSVGYAAQVGFDYMLEKNWGLNVDLKYAKIATDVNAVGGGKLGKLDLSPTMLGVGVTYRFK